MSEILSFNEFKESKRRLFEVAWCLPANLIEHKTSVLAGSANDALSLFRSFFKQDANIKINYVVEDGSTKIYHLIMSSGKQRFKGKIYCRSEKQVRDVCAYRFPALTLESVEEHETGGVE